jgi:hypothetical protein
VPYLECVCRLVRMSAHTHTSVVGLRACWLNIGSPVHLHSGMESDLHLHAGAKPGLFLHAEYYTQGLIQIYSYTRQKTYESLGAT